MEKISEFSGEYSFLSNFHMCTFIWNGWTWKSSEHAYQAAKFLDMGVWSDIQALDTPAKAKKAGKRKGIREDWDQIKLGVMNSIVRANFDTGKCISGGLIQEIEWFLYKIDRDQRRAISFKTAHEEYENKYGEDKS